MRKKTLLWLLFAVLLVSAGTVLVLGRQFYRGAIVEECDLYVGSQADYGALTDSLLPKLKYPGAFNFYARRIDLANNFKPGRYLLTPGMSVVRIARMLKLGLQTPVRVTINNVRTPPQLAQKLARQLEPDSATLLRAMRSPELAAELGFTPTTLFSLFLPNTYEFYWTTTPEELLRRMKREYDAFWTPERDRKRERSGLSRLEVTTLASIVAEETRQGDEMPRVAGVYINRLRKGMPLQADPTVKYAIGDFTLRRILHRHLQYPSPYNTYLNPGLPPSPICMPDVRVIDAVLDFEQHNYLYFCAKPTLDGSHNFARTLSEHNANARAYSAELNRRRIK